MACGLICEEDHYRHYCLLCSTNVELHEKCDDVDYCMRGGGCRWRKEAEGGEKDE